MLDTIVEQHETLPGLWYWALTCDGHVECEGTEATREAAQATADDHMDMAIFAEACRDPRI